MQKLTVTWTGRRPLIMGNPQTVDVTNPYSMESRRLNRLMKSTRKKEDEAKMQELALVQQSNDFAGSAYWADGEFYLPDTVIIACLKQAAQSMKKGKDIDRAVLMDETEAKVQTIAKFKTLDAAFDDKRFVLTCPCKIPPRTGSLTWKARCMIPTGWKVTFTLDFDEDQLAKGTLVDINKIAGAMVGVGGWRPKFGRFTVEAS